MLVRRWLGHTDHRHFEKMKLMYEGHKVYMNGKYPAIWLNGTNCHIHRLVWKKHNGEIPKGYVIHRKGVPVVAVKGDVVLHFNSIEEAAEFCKTYTACIQNCFNGKQKQSKGWTFRKE